MYGGRLFSRMLSDDEMATSSGVSCLSRCLALDRRWLMQRGPRAVVGA